MNNPFKFGSMVEDDFFTDREDELKSVLSVLKSQNHLILIAPRRYGKTSLIHKAVLLTKRPVLFLNLQLITSTSDLAAELLKRVFAKYPMARIRQLLLHFRVIPTVSLNPVSGAMDVFFAPTVEKPILEDVFGLIEKLGTQKHKPIVVLDEFQEICKVDPNLDKFLRSIIQHHKNVNYAFLGSQESLMREIFERKKSSFYHFGVLQTLDVIPHTYFIQFLEKRFAVIAKQRALSIANEIVDFTHLHPYYTQQLAFYYFEALRENKKVLLSSIVQKITRQHDIDFERLWMSLSIKDRQLMLELIISKPEGISQRNPRIPNSTRYSGYQRLLKAGFLVQSSKGYAVEDPFFTIWIRNKREEN